MKNENNKIITLINAEHIKSQAELACLLVETRKYFDEFNLSQPPIPDNVISFVPCRLLITEIEFEDMRQERIGRIQFLRGDETAYYDKERKIA